MRRVRSLIGGLAAVVAMTAMFLGSSLMALAAPVVIEGTATGSEETPPVAGPGTVQVRFTFDDATKVLTYTATVNGISTTEVTAAHIHRAPKGSSGPAVYTLSSTAFSNVSGQITLTDADVADLKAGNLYFNAHSVQNPATFARFQIILPQAPAAVSPPKTGDAGMAVKSVDSSFLALALAGFVVLGGLGTTAIVRRKA